jgi:hypothetical protein
MINYKKALNELKGAQKKIVNFENKIMQIKQELENIINKYSLIKAATSEIELKKVYEIRKCRYISCGKVLDFKHKLQYYCDDKNCKNDQRNYLKRRQRRKNKMFKKCANNDCENQLTKNNLQKYCVNCSVEKNEINVVNIKNIVEPAVKNKKTLPQKKSNKKTLPQKKSSRANKQTIDSLLEIFSKYISDYNNVIQPRLKKVITIIKNNDSHIAKCKKRIEDIGGKISMLSLELFVQRNCGYVDFE